MICQYCGGNALLTTGNKVYGPLNKDWTLRTRKFYWCKPCDAFAECFKGTETPIGQLANKEVRESRELVHLAVDKFIQNKKLVKALAYTWVCTSLQQKYDPNLSATSVEENKMALELLKEFETRAIL